MKRRIIILLIVLFLLGCNKNISDTCDYKGIIYNEGDSINIKKSDGIYEIKCENGQWNDIRKIDYFCKPYNQQIDKNFNIIFVNNMENDFENTVDNLIEGLFDYEPFSYYENKFNTFLFEGDVPKNNYKINQICNVPSSYIIFLDSGDDMLNSFTNAIKEKENDKYNTPYFIVLFTKKSITKFTLERIFVHEFGHLFARLDDEYVKERDYTILGGGNCDDAQSICKWSECFKGCTSPDFYRSSYDSIMKGLESEDLSLGFNEISVDIIKEKLNPSIIQSIIGPFYDTGESIKVNLRLEGNQLTISEIEYSKDKIKPIKSKGNYTLEILDYKDKIILSTKFNIMEENWCTFAGECHSKELESFSINLPYPAFVKSIRLLDRDKIIVTKNIGFKRESELLMEKNNIHYFWYILLAIILIVLFKDKIFKRKK